ncbi:MAG: hypothetical protein V4564_24590 [Pseudomonadota bacterium]
MRIPLWAITAAMILVASPAAARDVTVKVDARAMPWRVGINPKMPFGRNDGKGPAIVMGMHLLSGTKIRFKAMGTTDTIVGGEKFGPSGQAAYVTDANTGGSGGFFPSRYIPAAQYPVKLNQLIGTFIDADGRIIGKPFAIGESAEVEIPVGALAIALGINDDIFSDNSGVLDVVVSYAEGSVSVDEAK